MSYTVGVKMMNCAEIINTEKIVNILLLQEHPSNPSIQAWAGMMTLITGFVDILIDMLDA